MPVQTTTKEWQELPISKLAHFSRGISWRKTEESKDGILVVSIPNIKDGGIDFKSKYNHYITKKVPENKKLQLGDIIFVGSSGGLQNVGRNAMVKELPVGVAAFASFAFNARPDLSNVDPYFLYYLCNSSQVPFEKYTKRAADGKYNFQLRDFEKNLKLKVPPIPEQKAISQVLTTIQDGITEQEKFIEKLKDLKRSMMQSLFTRGTKGEKTKMAEIGEVPESWEVAEFKNMVEFSKKPRGLSLGANIPFVPMDMVPLDEMFIKNYETRKKVASGTFVINGDILLAKITPSFENGKQGILKIDSEYAYATTEVIPFHEKENASVKLFIYYWLKKDDVRNDLASKMEGSTGRQRLNKAVLDKKLMPKPSIFEQEEIAKTLFSVDQRTSVAQEKLSAYQNLFKTLLHELMSGERRVRY